MSNLHFGEIVQDKFNILNHRWNYQVQRGWPSWLSKGSPKWGISGLKPPSCFLSRARCTGLAWCNLPLLCDLWAITMERGLPVCTRRIAIVDYLVIKEGNFCILKCCPGRIFWNPGVLLSSEVAWESCNENMNKMEKKDSVQDQDGCPCRGEGGEFSLFPNAMPLFLYSLVEMLRVEKVSLLIK